MKAIWLVLVGATACSISLDEESESDDIRLDGGTSTASSEATTSAVATSSAVAPQSTSTAASSAGTVESTTTSSSSTFASSMSASSTASSVTQNTNSSVESIGTTDAGAQSELTSSEDSATSELDGGNSTTELPEEEPEPGKLAGITERHNYYREMVNMGAPLPALVWDADIAALAQEWAEVLAEDCSFEHSGRRGLGENLATFGASNEGGLTNTGTDAVDMWHSEVDCYTYGTIAGSSNMGTEECSAECDQYGGCGHYTQVVWRETLRVGCGVASCFREGFYWDTYVCNYDPPGNFIGEYPY